MKCLRLLKDEQVLLVDGDGVRGGLFQAWHNCMMFGELVSLVVIIFIPY